MEKVKKRFFIWLGVLLAALLIGTYLDSLMRTWSPIYLRVLAILGMVFSFLLLRVSGRTLKTLGEPEEWGWTTKLVTEGLYSCIRHPHHLGIGLFVTFLSMLVGLFTTLVTALLIWISIYLFLVRVEEPEALEKFGQEYQRYREKVPMLLGSPICLLREVINGLR